MLTELIAYTTCAYTRKDGQVNPDINELPAAGMVGKVVDAALANALAFVLTGDRDNSRIAASYIDTFFSDVRTGMKPNINFGQVVRGPPGSQLGSFMAVIDLRGITKIVNAIQILRAARAPDWSLDRDKRMLAWAAEYLRWLKSADIAQKAATAKK